MTESQKKILEMLAEKKISTDEAYRLLNALDTGDSGPKASSGEGTVSGKKAKYLRVTVTPDPDNPNPEHTDRVNVRVPMNLIRAGIKLTSLIPGEATDKVNEALKDKGINFDVRNVKPEDLEELILALADLEVDVSSSHGEKVKVFVE
jgi:Fe-S-cluster formation regulator IscX/YfhJ